MFGRKAKAAEVPASRFCVRAAELPYAHLYRYGRFTVAISKLTTIKEWPLRADHSAGTTAYGLLHGSATFKDGAEEPLLPVEVTFDAGHFINKGGIGSGHFDRSTRDGTYVLYVHIHDADGSILQAFDAALQRSILSGDNFIHLHCVQDRAPAEPVRTDYMAQAEEDRSYLRKVEAGDAKLETILFDKVFFEDALVTKAPGWSWNWNQWDFHHPRFHSKGTAKWRRELLPHQLK
jgi:hypothetical protein